MNQLISLEIKKGLNKVTAYRKIAERVEKLKEDLVNLTKIKSENKKVIGCRAAAKGNTLSKYYHIKPELSLS